MEAFRDQIDHVNALADAAPGFLWRLESDEGGSSYVNAFDDPRLLVNLSAWDSIASLRHFIMSEGHVAVMRRRGDWFQAGTTESIVWDIPADHRPDLEEALGMLEAWRKGSGPAQDLRGLMR